MPSVLPHVGADACPWCAAVPPPSLCTVSRALKRGTRARGTRAGRGLPSAPSSGCRRCKLTGKGVFTRERPERSRNLPPPRHAELLAQHVAMRLRSPRRDAETLADLLIGAAERDEDDHLALPLC